MRVALPLMALLLAAPAAADSPKASSAMLERMPLTVLTGPVAQSTGQPVCADRIQQVREERGLPKLDSGAAASDELLMILAVDKRIGGCSVMVMAYDANDIRPVPTAEGPAKLRKIR